MKSITDLKPGLLLIVAGCLFVCNHSAAMAYVDGASNALDQRDAMFDQFRNNPPVYNDFYSEQQPEKGTTASSSLPKNHPSVDIHYRKSIAGELDWLILIDDALQNDPDLKGKVLINEIDDDWVDAANAALDKDDSRPFIVREVLRDDDDMPQGTTPAGDKYPVIMFKRQPDADSPVLTEQGKEPAPAELKAEIVKVFADDLKPAAQTK